MSLGHAAIHSVTSKVFPATHTRARLTPRVSCGARTPPPSPRGPPARRQLQPVVRWPNFPTSHHLYPRFLTGSPSLTASPCLAPDPGVVNHWRRVDDSVRSASVTADANATSPLIDPGQTPPRWSK